MIVYTRATKDDEAESIKNSINEFLKAHGETLSNDIFGITFIKVNAREERRENFGDISYYPCFGLSTLMATCFNKGEKSYRIAIKNSLIQIGKNKIIEYINNICDQLANNLNYYFYLSQAFEPNFPNYLAYCFEKITDEDLTGNLCMFCQKNTPGPYKCSFCGALACEDCYIGQFQQKDVPSCALCGQELVQNQNMEKKVNNINYGNNNLPKNINYMNILKNKLNLESINLINNYIEEYKNELIGLVNQKFDQFTKESAKKLYTKILEKYTENMANNPTGSNLKESMKSKEVLKSEVTQKLNLVLKDKAIEDFLKKTTSEIFQQIIEIFKKRRIYC